MFSQLTLGVSLQDTATFANYFVGANIQLIETLRHVCQSEQGERMIYYYGASGLGRTHLMQACCHAAHRAGLSVVYLPLQDMVSLSPIVFEGIETRKLICIDDVQCIAGKRDWEEVFFHAYNRIQQAGGTLLVTANLPPKGLQFIMPDVASRLAAGVIFQLQPLSDDEKLQMLVMRATLRGMVLPEEVGRFILTHCPRHLATLCAALDVLDRMSLAAQRRLTIPFVKQVLQI